jgi:hypothetical protein
MQENLARAIENRKATYALAKLTARESQCIYQNSSPMVYFDEFNKLSYFYENLNRYFITHDSIHLNDCYQCYGDFENEGWVVEKGRLVNLVFKRLISKIELTVETWFYQYAVNLDFEWLQNNLETIIQSELKEFKNSREKAKVDPISFESFKKQIDLFPEMRLKYLPENKLEDYLDFSVFSLGLDDWDYRKPVIYESPPMYSTEINVPVIELNLSEIIYSKLEQLGIEWANKYITEPTARNTFIKKNGLLYA